MFLPVLHVTVISTNLYTIWYDQNYLKLPFVPELDKYRLAFNNRMVFLTVWGLVLQTVYFIVALLNDIFGTNERSPTKTPIIRLFKDALFSLAFPIAMYVSIAFWVIYTVNKDLIWPDELANLMPFWVNHVMHTLVAVFILLELIFSPRNYPSRKTGMRLMIGFSVCYLIYLNYVYHITDTFIYPFLDVLNWPLRIVYFTINTLLGLGMYVVGENIDLVVNRSGKANKAKLC